MIEQTRFLCTVFLCSSEFKLENIYSGVKFCGKSVCGNFYLPELIFADRWKNNNNNNNNIYYLYCAFSIKYSKAHHNSK